MVNWRSDKDGEIVTDTSSDLKLIRRSNVPRKKQAGGLLVGPSHEQGGIPTRIKSTGEIFSMRYSKLGSAEPLSAALGESAWGVRFLAFSLSYLIFPVFTYYF